MKERQNMKKIEIERRLRKENERKKERKRIKKSIHSNVFSKIKIHSLSNLSFIQKELEIKQHIQLNL